jgi:hypothetical protein
VLSFVKCARIPLDMKTFKFDDLWSAPLVVDAVYEGGTFGNLKSEVISKVLSAENDKGEILKVHTIRIPI